MEKLVEAVTKEIMRRLEAAGDGKRILVLGKDESCPIAGCLGEKFQADVRPDLESKGNYDFVVLPVWYLDKLTGGKAPVTESKAAPAQAGGGEVLDFTGKRLIHERELREKCDSRTTGLRVDKKAIITQLASDFIRQRGLQVTRVG